MAIKASDRAPDFTLKDQHGADVTLSELWKRGPVVLFFYPKDFTPGCTAEACEFRDQYEDFKTVGATVVGISSQGTESKKAFAEKHRLPYTLVADEGGAVREKFGVKGSFFGLLDGRETYVIDSQGVVRHVFNSQVQPGKHVTEALGVLKTLKQAA
ncbi:MAG: peroxiredoxin [Archangiaceae bacterium]|nr:peroxiredoxin [Archangiaceae bacterium]